MKLAYDMLVCREGETSSDILSTIKVRYDAGENDEFLKPIILDTEGGIKEGDVCIFFNFRRSSFQSLCITDRTLYA